LEVIPAGAFKRAWSIIFSQFVYLIDDSKKKNFNRRKRRVSKSDDGKRRV